MRRYFGGWGPDLLTVAQFREVVANIHTLKLAEQGKQDHERVAKELAKRKRRANQRQSS